MPARRCTASDASASARLAAPWPPALGPASASSQPAAAASHAPTSTAAQSCSPPPKAISTLPSSARATPATSATSAGLRSSSSPALGELRRIDEDEVALW